MRQGSFIAVAALLILLIGGAVGVYAYDSGREDLISEGVSVEGIDIGGMRAAEARAALEEQLAAPLRRPVTVRYGARRFVLSPRTARLRADVEGMVQDALRESRDGNVVSRSFRSLTGGEVTVDLPARVSFSPRAVAALVRRVKRAVDRPPRNAEVSPSAAGLSTISSRNGRTVRGRELGRRIAAELVRPDGRRVVKARTIVTKPKVTTRDLARRYPVYLVVNRSGFQLQLYRNLRLARTYTIAIGQVGFDTPAGLYHIQNKAVNAAWQVPNKAWAGSLAGQLIPGGAPNNPLKARWLGIYDGAGIHGTDQVGSLGTAASHGCIRMAIPDVIELYDQVPVQTPIYIA